MRRGTRSRHGTRTRYCRGCRCEHCREANSRYARAWWSSRRYSTDPRYRCSCGEERHIADGACRDCRACGRLMRQVVPLPSFEQLLELGVAPWTSELARRVLARAASRRGGR